MVGMAGFEPTNARVKVWCLTAWRHPNIEKSETKHWHHDKHSKMHRKKEMWGG